MCGRIVSKVRRFCLHHACKRSTAVYLGNVRGTGDKRHIGTLSLRTRVPVKPAQDDCIDGIFQICLCERGHGL
jgi:hypothetical protein